VRLTDEKEKMLRDAVEMHDGVVKMSHAFNMYSSKEAAKNAVKTLEAYDFVEYDKPGYFEVKALPEGLEDLESKLDQKVEGETFVEKVLGRVFRKIKRRKNKRPSVDPENVKYATGEQG
jgi:hypothetical protein